MAALLAALAPIILHVEDLHQASPERLELWQNLAHSISRSQEVALLVTSRARLPEPFEVVKVEPLSRAGSSALLEAEIGASLPPKATGWIYARALGNPLFTLEYLRFLTRQGHLWNDGQKWRWRAPPDERLPSTIEALLERQILEASADETVRRTLEAKAMLPLGTSAKVWAEVARLEEGQLEAAQNLLLQQGILRGEDFAHPLFREVRLKTLRPERKQTLARRALQAFEDDPAMAASFLSDAGLEHREALALLKRAAGSVKNKVHGAQLLAQAVEYAAGEEQGNLAVEAGELLKNYTPFRGLTIGWD